MVLKIILSISTMIPKAMKSLTTSSMLSAWAIFRMLRNSVRTAEVYLMKQKENAKTMFLFLNFSGLFTKNLIISTALLTSGIIEIWRMMAQISLVKFKDISPWYKKSLFKVANHFFQMSSEEDSAITSLTTNNPSPIYMKHVKKALKLRSLWSITSSDVIKVRYERQ